MEPQHLKPIWTADDFRALITDLRALAEPERSNAAQVVDLFTRQVIA